MSPSGHFWNKLGTFLWILEYDLQLGRKVVQCYDPQIEDAFLTIEIIHCGRFSLEESNKYRLMHRSRYADSQTSVVSWDVCVGTSGFFNVVI